MPLFDEPSSMACHKLQVGEGLHMLSYTFLSVVQVDKAPWCRAVWYS